MKRFAVLLLCLLVSGLAFGQAIDLSQVQLTDLDLTKADLSDAAIYFAGPVDLMITNVKYMGMTFMAVLKYDGEGVIEVGVPTTDSAEGLPAALDFSKIALSLVSDGIQIDNIIADGYYFSGKLVPTPTLDLALSPPIILGGTATLPDLREDVTRLQTDVNMLRRDLRLAQAARTDAESQTTTLQRNLTQSQGQVTTLQRDLTQSQNSLTDARSRITTLEAQARAASTVTTVGPFDVARSVTGLVKSGWAGGSSALGTWTMSGATLRQTAAGEFFAKYVVPVRQDANELVYMFTGTGSAAGWSGYGLHFLASGSTNGGLYGYGTSYLVWVTRDPQNTQSEQTYVQLYRSYDDIKMVQVASKAIPGSIDRSINVGVYVNRSTGTIGIGTLGAVDTVVIEYQDPAIIRTGTQVVARALGQATISDVSVLSK